MNYEVIATASDWAAARRTLLTEDGNENAGVFFCGLSATETSARLLVRDFVAVADEQYVERLPYHLEIDPRFYNDIITRCLSTGLHPIVVHSHPTDNPARYSQSDDYGESRLLSVLQQLLPDRVVCSMVVSRSSVTARQLIGSRFHALHGLRIVGPAVEFCEFAALTTSTDIDPKFERQVRAIGEGHQRLLSRLKVAVIGVGGTGSLTAEQVTRTGVGHLVLVDDDQVDETNLSRLVGATSGDIGRPKVSVIARHLATLASNRIEPIHDSAIKQDVLRRLRDCDVIFSCVDNDRTRAILNRFAHQYLIPLFDMGVRIDARGGFVSAAAGRMSFVGIDGTCLRCSHHLDSSRIFAESLTPVARAALAREGYVLGLDEAVPAVISLNAVVSGLAVTAFLNVFTGLTGGRQASGQIYDATSGSVFTLVPSHEPRCDVCDPEVGVKALGDSQVVSAY